MHVNDNEVLLQEVGPRDGLQNESAVLSVEDRTALVEHLSASGLRRIQIGSFVNPKLVPQMAGTDELWRRLNKSTDIRYSVLVLNKKGLEKAVAEGIPHVEIYVSASETHSFKNSGASTEQALESAVATIETAHQNGIGVTAGIMCAFGCFYEGAVPLERILQMLSKFMRVRPLEIGLADTSGMADPESVKTFLEAVRGEISAERIGLHLHDTKGLGIRNMIAALEMGVRRFDASIGGLGGCPFITGAVGNISTERTVEILHSMGFQTGVNLQVLHETREKLLCRLTNAIGRKNQARRSYE